MKDIIYGKEYGETFTSKVELRGEELLNVVRGLADAHYPEGAALEIGKDTEISYEPGSKERIWRYYWKHPRLPSHFKTGERYQYVDKIYV